MQGQSGKLTHLGGAATIEETCRGSTTFSIVLTLAVSIGVLVFLAVGSVLAIQWSAAQKNTFSLLNEKVDLTLSMIEAGIRAHLDPAAKKAEYLAHRIEADNFQIGANDRLRALMNGALAASPQIEAIMIFNAELQGFGLRRDEGFAVSDFYREGRDYDIVVEAAAGLRQAEGAFWGELVYTSDTTMINLRRPLRRDGTFLGFIVVVVTVPALSDLMRQIGDLFEGTAFILHGHDHVLAHPNLTSSHPDQSEASPTVALNRVGDPVLANLWQGRSLRGFDLAGAAEEKVMDVPIDGVHYVAILKEIRDYGPVPWTIGIWFLADDVADETKRLLAAAVAGVAVLALAIAAAIFLGRWLAKPIRRLASSAARIGDLELSEVDDLPPSRILEINEQARAFNTMLKGLRAFETYVPRRLVQGLIRKDGGGDIASGERELTVLFTDIVGFTTMSERLPAGEVAEFLNQHFALLGACVEEQGGTIDKFIGDALMAFWGAPEPQSNTAERACRAALAMIAAVEADNAERQIDGKPSIRIRVGIHTGPVVVGNIGAPGRINYTVVGDAVNVAQRVEGLGKTLDNNSSVTVLMSDVTAARLPASFHIEPAGSFSLKGRQQEMSCFRLTPQNNH